ncbi:MAG: hypothetical protein RIC06_19210 [Cyclobacteriaceae bacterium]
MKTDVGLKIKDNAATSLSNLTKEERFAISEWINDMIFPTGGDQILIAIELIERGLPVELITKISRLDQDFVTELSQNIKNR